MMLGKDLTIGSVREFFEQRFSGEGYGLLSERRIQRTVEHLREYLPTIKTLDFGCGQGRYCETWKSLGLDVVGVDISEKGIKMFRQTGFPGIVIDGMNLPFRDDCFDLIVSLGVLYHIPDSELAEVEREFWRVVKDGGLLFLVMGRRRMAKKPEEVRVVLEEGLLAKFRLPTYYSSLFSRWLALFDDGMYYLFRKEVE